jgi:hypothetical protein
VDDENTLRLAFLGESLPEGHWFARMCLMKEIRGVNPIDLLLCDREVENDVAIGDGVVFLILETEDVGTILAVSSQPLHY